MNRRSWAVVQVGRTPASPSAASRETRWWCVGGCPAGAAEGGATGRRCARSPSSGVARTGAGAAGAATGAGAGGAGTDAGGACSTGAVVTAESAAGGVTAGAAEAVIAVAAGTTGSGAAGAGAAGAAGTGAAVLATGGASATGGGASGTAGGALGGGVTGAADARARPWVPGAGRAGLGAWCGERPCRPRRLIGSPDGCTRAVARAGRMHGWDCSARPGTADRRIIPPRPGSRSRRPVSRRRPAGPATPR